ncbi:MAG: alkaline phosphatase family protein [Candidatus Bathyarchaeia archaeon]
MTVYRTEVRAATGFAEPSEISSALMNQTLLPLESPDWKGLSQGWFGEDVYMETFEMAADWYLNSTAYCLNKTLWQAFVASYPLVAELQEAFLGYVTPGHPRYQAGVKDAYLNRIGRAYVRLDALVGSLLSQMDENTLLVLVSPSGSTPVARVFYVNRWLRDRGWLATTAEGEVDWSLTRAYYLGDGQLFVNLAGREVNGTVPVSEYPSFIAELSSALTSAPVALVVSPSSMGLLGLGTDRAGDLALVPASGWALSDALGGNETTAQSPPYLTGELGLYPIHDGAEGFIAIKGPYVTNRQLGKAQVVDVRPTLTAFLRLKWTDDYDGRPLSSAFTVKVGDQTVVNQGIVALDGIRALEKQLTDLQGTVSKVKAEAAVYPFVAGLISVVIGLAAGSAIGRRRHG